LHFVRDNITTNFQKCQFAMAPVQGTCIVSELVVVMFTSHCHWNYRA
jgi:hypothetical protein